ncbi:hypothetical protein SAMN04487897_106111 [Paenibacillus sp. yr247]|uniref:DUF2332 domain-containing protein n=1 Tax=Paenibacillus sp. yr247 TaxID=1761880 RepID=UPI00087F1C1C|nr:DUF2332 domain-containing protein [Paenibacillus sp. yr247]SDN95413.1 hypothetical protein SAMN04487897_106111 [Paenibacillus sp. yr247]
MDINLLSERFKVFAERECKDSSILYGHLAENIAYDTKLLKLAAHSRLGQPVPNLLLGAVHYLLLGGIEHELAEYYASIVDEPRESSAAIDCFRDFCNLYENEIIQILESKLVQTNEVRRCAYLYPSFCYIYKITKKPLALIEIGTSAGLQLLWDKYSYSYNSNKKYGNDQSALEITAEIRGDKIPFLFEHCPPVTSRIGLDLHVNDLNDPEDYLWLKALIWPEHKERISYFEKAALCLEKQPLELIKGDGIALLPNMVSKITKDSTICVFHTHVANQISNEAKIKLSEYIQYLGEERDVFHLYNNMWDLELHLDYYVDGNVRTKTLAETDGHGRWFQWKL